MSEGFLDYLKRERDITVKPMLSGEKTAIRFTTALRLKLILLESLDFTLIVTMVF